MKKILTALLFLSALSPVFVFAQNIPVVQPDTNQPAPVLRPDTVQPTVPVIKPDAVQPIPVIRPDTVQPGGESSQTGNGNSTTFGGTSNQGGGNSNTVQPIASLPNPLGDKVSSIPDLFYLIVNALISVSYVVIAFFLIWSGFKFVVAQGEPDKLTDAKNTFKYTIIGALIIIGAQTIIAIVKSIISGLGITG